MLTPESKNTPVSVKTGGKEKQSIRELIDSIGNCLVKLHIWARAKPDDRKPTDSLYTRLKRNPKITIDKADQGSEMEDRASHCADVKNQEK